MTHECDRQIDRHCRSICRASLRCAAENQYTVSVEKQYVICDWCCAAPPVLVNVSPDVVVRNEGDDVDIFCEATATPSATLTWFKDGRQLASSGHVTVAGNHVVLRGVERSDAGVYSCTFKNVVGTVSHLIKLVIQGVFTLQLSDLACFCLTSELQQITHAVIL